MAMYNGRRVLQVLRFGSIVKVNDQPVETFDADTKLDKQTGTTPFAQAYIKTASGNQQMIDIAQSNEAGAMVQRRAGGFISVPQNPSDDAYATPKKYVDDNFLAKRTNTTTYPQAYVKNDDGTQAAVDIVFNGYDAGSIVRRTAQGRIVCADPSAANHAATKGYVDSNYSGVYKHDVTILLNREGTGNEFYKIRGHVFNNSSTALTTLSEVFADLICEYVGDTSGNGYAVQKIPRGFAYGVFTNPRPAFIFTSSAGVVTYIDPSDTSVISDVSVSDVAAKL